MLTKVHIVKAMVFPVVMYGCDSWTIKKAEWGRIDSFELWCWIILFRVPWTARRSNLSILKEINPGIFIGRTDAKAEIPVFGHLIQRADSLEKDPNAGKDWRQEEKGTTEDEMDGITDLMDMSLSKLRELVLDKEAWHAAVHRITKSWTQLSHWTDKWDEKSSSDGQESACNAVDLGSIPGLGRSLGEGHGYPLQYSCLENFMDRGAWEATVHGVEKVRHDWVTNTHTQFLDY